MGYTLKDIGSYYDMREPAARQSNSRFKKEIERQNDLKAKLKEIADLLNIETLHRLPTLTGSAVRTAERSGDLGNRIIYPVLGDLLRPGRFE